MAQTQLVPERPVLLDRIQGEVGRQAGKLVETGRDKPGLKQERTPGRQGSKGTPRAEGAESHADHEAPGIDPAPATGRHRQIQTRMYQGDAFATYTRQDRGKPATPSRIRQQGPEALVRAAGRTSAEA